MTIFYQAVSAGIVSYLCLSLGLMYTWPSSTLSLFSSANTTLDRPMTETEIAFFGSLSYVSSLISTPFSSYLLDNLGRKNCCLLFSCVQVLSWVIVTFFYNVGAILFSIFLSGFCGCVLLAVPIYISEFCQDSIRGTMTSCALAFYGIGMLVSYLMGGTLKYDHMNYACLTLSILGVVLVTLLRESPMFLMSKGREMEAARAVAFFRGVSVKSKAVVEELEAIRQALNSKLDDELPEEEKLKHELCKKPKVSAWQFLGKSRSTRQALFVIIVLYTASIFQGLMVVQVYAEPLFTQAVPSMSSTVSCVIFTAVTVAAGFVAAFLIDIAGRRVLMIHASIASGVCCVILGTQIHLRCGPYWVTAVVMYIFGTVYTCGAGTVPYVMVAEIFLPEIRSFTSMLAYEWSLFCGFVILFIFNPLVSTIGLGPIFYFFAVVCFLSAVFSYFFLPETKGLTSDAIQILFVKRDHREPLEITK